jgi:DNA polymerase III epsilon subunit-like protein
MNNLFLLADTETTGIRPTDRVVEVAWLLIDDEFQTVDRGHSLIDPEMAIPSSASAVHGLTNRDVIGAPTIEEYFFEQLGGQLSRGDFIFCAHNCVTGDHEVLTEEGWTRFDQLQDGQRVLQWDPRTSEMTFADCLVVRKAYDGPLLQWDTQYHKGIYTPGHRFVRKGQTDSKWRFSTAEEMSKIGPNTSKIPVAGLYEAEMPLDISETEARVLEMIRADGNIQITSAGSFSARMKFKRPEKITRCQKLLEAAGIPFSVCAGDNGSTVVRTLKSCVAQKLCSLLGAGRSKMYGRWVMDLSLAARQAILDELAHWDGYEVAGAGNRQVAVTSSKEADVCWIREMAVLSGRCAVVILDRPNDKSGFSKEGGRISHVRVRPRAEVKTLERPVEVQFSGTVYCVTVPTGAFLVRRQGVTWVTGNCAFDYRFLSPFLPEGTPQMCTLRLARRIYPNADNHKLATLVYALELDVGKDRFHSADGDMDTLFALLRKMSDDTGRSLYELFELANSPVEHITMPFGKHAGMPLKDVPPNYVKWFMAKAENPDQDLVRAFKKLGY